MAKGFDGLRRINYGDSALYSQRGVDDARQRAQDAYDQSRANESEFYKGLRGGLQGLEAAYHGVGSMKNAILGDEEGAIRSAEKAQRISENAAKLGPTVTDLSQVEDLSSGRSYVEGMLGQALPSIVTSLVGAAAGAAAAGPAGAIAGGASGFTRGVGEKLAVSAVKRIAENYTKKNIRRGLGIGTYASSLFQQAGSMQQNVLDPANRAAWEQVQRGERVQDARNGARGFVYKYIDGDSFMFQPEDGSEPYQIRLPHINTADTGQEGKDAAAQKFRELTYGRRLAVEPSDKVDAYGRHIADVYTDSTDESVGRQMLASGAATIHPAFPGQKDLFKQERIGRQQPGALPNYTSRRAAAPLTPEQAAARDKLGDIPDAAVSVFGKPLSLREQSIINLLGAGASALPDSVLPMHIAQRFGLAGQAKKLVQQELKKEGGLKAVLGDTAKRITREAGKGMPVEGATEGLQTFIERVTNKFIDQNKEVLGEEGIGEILNASVAGAIGGMWGGVGGIMPDTPSMRALNQQIDKLNQEALSAGEKGSYDIEDIGGYQGAATDTAYFDLADDGSDALPDTPRVTRGFTEEQGQYDTQTKAWDRNFLTKPTGEMYMATSRDALAQLGSDPEAIKQSNSLEKAVAKANKAAGDPNAYQIVSLRQAVEAEAAKQHPDDPQAQQTFVRDYARQKFEESAGMRLRQRVEANGREYDNIVKKMEGAQRVIDDPSMPSDMKSKARDQLRDLNEVKKLADHRLRKDSTALENVKDHSALFNEANPAAYLEHFQVAEGPAAEPNLQEFNLSDKQMRDVTRSVTENYKPTESQTVVKTADGKRKSINLRNLVAVVSQQMFASDQAMDIDHSSRGFERNIGDQLLMGLSLLSEKGVIQMPKTAPGQKAQMAMRQKLIERLGPDTVVYQKGKKVVTVRQALTAKAQPRAAKWEGDPGDIVQETGKEVGAQSEKMSPVYQPEAVKGGYVAPNPMRSSDPRLDKLKSTEDRDYTPNELRTIAKRRVRAIGQALTQARADTTLKTAQSMVQQFIGKKALEEFRGERQGVVRLKALRMLEQAQEKAQQQSEATDNALMMEVNKSAATGSHRPAKAPQTAEQRAYNKLRGSRKVMEKPAAPAPKQKAAPLNSKRIDAVADVALKENYERLDTPQKVLAFAKLAKETLRDLVNRSEDSLSDQHLDLKIQLESMFNPHQFAAFDWDMLMDGLSPTKAQMAELDAIAKSYKESSAKAYMDRMVEPASTAQLIAEGDPASLKRENAILKTWAQRLGLNLEITLIQAADLEEMYKRSPDPDGLRRRVEMGAQYGLAQYDGKQLRVFVHPLIKEPMARLETIGHELGHAVKNYLYREADQSTKDAIFASYNDFLAKANGLNVTEINALKKAAATMTGRYGQEVDTRTLDKLSPEHQQYLLDFEEWFADQTSRWLTTNKKAVGVVNTFFNRVANMLRQMFDILRKQGYKADDNVAQYLESIWNANRSTDPVVNLVNELAVGGNGFHDKLAAAMAHPGVANYEAAVRLGIHEFLKKPERIVLGRALYTRNMRNKVRALLIEDKRTGALSEQRRNPEAQLGLAYEYWSAGRLKLGPQTEGVFKKLAKVVKQFFGFPDNVKQAEKVLQAMAQGRVTQRLLAQTNEVFATPERLTDTAVQRATAAVIDMTGPLTQYGKALFVTADGRLRAMKNPWVTKIADIFAAETGSQGNRDAYFEDMRKYHTQFLNRVLKIFTDKDEQFGQEFVAAMSKGEVSDNPEIAAAQRKVAAMFHDLRSYLTEAGVDLGDRGELYWPQSYDLEYLAAHDGDLVELLLQHADDAFLGGEVEFDAKQGKKVFIPGTDELTPEQRRVAASRIVHALFEDKGSGDGELTNSKPGQRPFMSAFDLRLMSSELTGIPQEALAPFLSKDPGIVLQTYVNQAVKRAEFTRRFGRDGERLDTMLSRAQEYGLTGAQRKVVDNYIHAMLGTLGADKISPSARKAMGAMMVFQNLRVLALASFSSLIDPLGIYMRSGDMQASLHAFKAGLKAWVVDNRGDKDALAELGKAVGIVDADLTNEALNWEYGGVFLGGAASKWNSALFKWNGLQDLTKMTRLMALDAGKAFLVKHATSPNEKSARFLDQLNITGEEIRADMKDGALKGESEAVQQALVRFVDESILRPNASQRPIWGSDPRWMLIFHLKQFTYSFYNTILKRVYTEYADHGNLAPAMRLMTYIPLMIAADLVRDALKDMGGDGEADRKEEWTLGDYIWEGTQRAGLLGVGQFAVDAMDASEHGKPFPLPFAGPTAEWGYSLGEAAYRGNIGEWLTKQYPGQSLVNPVVDSFTGP